MTRPMTAAEKEQSSLLNLSRQQLDCPVSKDGRQKEQSGAFSWQAIPSRKLLPVVIPKLSYIISANYIVMCWTAIHRDDICTYFCTYYYNILLTSDNGEAYSRLSGIFSAPNNR